MMAEVLLSAISLQPGNGGIAAMARLLAKVLSEEQKVGLLQVRGLTLTDSEVPAGLAFPVALARGSKFRFCMGALRAALSCHHFIYDGCHLAQIHGMPLLSRKPSLAFICGIEVWENTKAGYLNSARRATILISISNYTLAKAEQLHGRLPNARVCWLGTNSDELPTPSNQNRLQPPQVLIVARLRDRYKGHRELIASWPRVNASVPDAVLRIVGSGPDRKALESNARQSPAAERIVFEGFVPQSAIESLYAQSTIFGMPSRGEGFGLVYVEAMRHGLPVIASVHDAAPEIVLDGQTGYTVNLDQPNELPERIIHLLKNPDKAKQMGVNGQRRWAEHFCYSAFRDRFRPILREFVNLD